ncbi:MAG: FAD:protein FMN transferase [Patescibacteria group bacterium]
MPSFGYTGLGTKWLVTINDLLSQDALTEIAKNIKLRISNFHNNYSRFIDNNFTGTLNTKKVITEFDQEFLDLIIHSQKLKHISNGYFDISLGSKLENIGYDKKLKQKVTSKTRSSETLFQPATKNQCNISQEIIDQSFLYINTDKIIISKDVQIDFGGIGKGWLVDKLCNYFRSLGLNKFSINAGGDIYSTMGRFYLEHPALNNQMIGYIDIQNQAIGCSSANRRKFNEDQHHLINPNSGKSPNNYLAVFTQAESTTQADVGSTILFVCPPTSLDIIAKQIKVEYLLILPDFTFIRSEGYVGKLFT